MDDDYRLYNLGDNLSDSNTDDHDDIDSDLEDKLYAAVFHANDVSSKGQDIPGYNNFTSLTDVISSWKNIPDDNSGKFLYNPQNSDENNALESDTGKILASKNDAIDSVNNVSCGKKGEIDGLRNQEAVENNEPCHDLNDKEVEADIYSNKDTRFEMEIVRGKDTVEDRSENEFINGNKSPEKKINKKQKNSPIKKLSKSKESRDGYSPVKYSRGNDVDLDSDDIPAENDLKNSPVLQTTSESSDIKTKEEVDKDESMANEKRIFLFGNENCAVEEGPERPSSIKPEEEIEKSQSMGDEIVEKRSKEVAEVKPEEEQVEKVKLTENEALVSSSDSSSSDSSSGDSSCSFSEHNTQDTKDTKQNDKPLLVGNVWNEIITLDDSDNSIYEIPVPPKPRPPTINLEDSESSTSSDSDTSTEIMTPEKLVESYRMALSESKSKNQNTRGEAKSTGNNKGAGSSGRYSSMSGSDDSMTESEEENWGIIAGSQMNKDKPTMSSSTDVRMSEIVDNLSTDIQQQDSSCQIMENGHESTELVAVEDENLIRESAADCLDITKKTSGDLSERSLVIVQPFGEEERLFPSHQRLTESSQMENDQGNYEDISEADTLLINVESDRSLLDFDGDRTPEISTRTSENRKRPITDSGKRSKHQHSPKKNKSSDDAAVAGPSTSKSLKENKENTDKQRNCAADYFFKPMSNEMENYYNKSWGGETFDIDAIRRQMPRDPRHWAVLNEDLLGYQQRRSRYWTESKCRNCNHTGHHMAECPEKKKLPSCHMCGTPGHKEPRCPHKMCLGCGKKQKVYMQVCNGCRKAWCNGCQSHGHVENNCPDLWRRYHVTTSHRDVNTHLRTEDVMKPQRLLSCCNCAERGHDSTTCDSYRWSRHFPTPSYVTNYTTGPTYGEHRMLEGSEFPSESRDQTETEKRQTDGSIAHTSSSSNEGEKQKSNTNDATKENREVDEFLRSTSINEIDKNVKKVEEQSKEQRKSNKEKPQKSDELLTKNSNTTEREEILFTLKSKLIDTKFEQAANYGECIVPLLAKQYGILVSSDLGRKFLQNLTSQFPMKLEMKRCENGGIAISISSTRDLHYPIHLTIMDWLKWKLTEQSRFVKLNLPTKKQDLVKLLTSKLDELKHHLGDPFKLYAKIQSLKGQLAKLQRQSAAGKKMSTSSKRARIVEELAKSQCKLNMILFGQVKVNDSDKNYKFLKNTLLAMKKPSSPNYVCAATYLQVVHHYNIIFAPYTPEKLNALLDIYFRKYSGQGSCNCKRQIPPARATNATYANFIKELDKLNQRENTNSSISEIPNEVIMLDTNSERGGSSSVLNRSVNSGQGATRQKNVRSIHNVPSIRDNDVKYIRFFKDPNIVNQNRNTNSSMVDDSSRVISLDMNNEREDSVHVSNKIVNYDGVESQFVVPGEIFQGNTTSHSNLPPAQIPFEYNKGRRETNYYNSRYNFGDNSRSQRYKDTAQDNSLQDNYTALDNRSSQNDYYNVERDFNNIGCGDVDKKSRGYYTERSTPRNRMNDTISNGFENCPVTNVQSNYSSERNRWQEGNPSINTLSQDIFISDNRAELFQNVIHNDTSDVYSRTEFDRRNRYDVNGPSTSGMHNHDKNLGTGTRQHRIGNNKKKRKKDNRGPKLPLYLQKRAEKSIIKYINVGVPRINQAAKELQGKLRNKDLTLECVIKFEELVKRKLKKTDHLL